MVELVPVVEYAPAVVPIELVHPDNMSVPEVDELSVITLGTQ